MFISFFIINFTSTQFNEKGWEKHSINYLFISVSPLDKKNSFFLKIHKKKWNFLKLMTLFLLPSPHNYLIFMCKTFPNNKWTQKKTRNFPQFKLCMKMKRKKSKSKVHCSCLLKFLHTNSERRHNNRHLVKRERESEKW